MGGLTCAAALARRGKKICLYERNPSLGGYQATYRKKGFVIEPCLHIMAEAGPEGVLTQLLDDLGLGQKIEFSRFSPTSQFIFPDRTVTVPKDGEDFLGLLKSHFPVDAEVTGVWVMTGAVSTGVLH